MQYLLANVHLYLHWFLSIGDHLSIFGFVFPWWSFTSSALYFQATAATRSQVRALNWKSRNLCIPRWLFCLAVLWVCIFLQGSERSEGSAVGMRDREVGLWPTKPHVEESHWSFTSEWVQSHYFAIHTGSGNRHAGRLLHVRIHGLARHIDFISVYQHSEFQTIYMLDTDNGALHTLSSLNIPGLTFCVWHQTPRGWQPGWTKAQRRIHDCCDNYALFQPVHVSRLPTMRRMLKTTTCSFRKQIAWQDGSPTSMEKRNRTQAAATAEGFPNAGVMGLYAFCRSMEGSASMASICLPSRSLRIFVMDCTNKRPAFHANNLEARLPSSTRTLERGELTSSSSRLPFGIVSSMDDA